MPRTILCKKLRYCVESQPSICGQGGLRQSTEIAIPTSEAWINIVGGRPTKIRLKNFTKNIKKEAQPIEVELKWNKNKKICSSTPIIIYFNVEKK